MVRVTVGQASVRFAPASWKPTILTEEFRISLQFLKTNTGITTRPLLSKKWIKGHPTTLVIHPHPSGRAGSHISPLCYCWSNADFASSLNILMETDAYKNEFYTALYLDNRHNWGSCFFNSVFCRRNARQISIKVGVERIQWFAFVKHKHYFK
jgi:hypothetical protein